MALRNITIQEMLGISAAWTSATKDGSRPVFERVPALAVLLAPLDDAHDLLVRAQSPTITAASAALMAISEETLVEDGLHDRFLRAGIKALDMLIELAGLDSPEGKRYSEMRDSLYPDGAAIAGQSYVAESGNALRVQQVLDANPGLQKGLSAITLSDSQAAKKYTLLSIVKGQIKAGAALGQLEAKRTALLSAPPDAAALKKAPPTLSEARNAWMSVVSDIVRLSKYAPEVEKPFVEAALQHLQRVEKLADARAARRGAASLASDAEASEVPAKEPDAKPK